MGYYIYIYDFDIPYHTWQYDFIMTLPRFMLKSPHFATSLPCRAVPSPPFRHHDRSAPCTRRRAACPWSTPGAKTVAHGMMGVFFLWRLFVFFYLTFGYFWGLTMFSSMIFGGLAGSFWSISDHFGIIGDNHGPGTSPFNCVVYSVGLNAIMQTCGRGLVDETGLWESNAETWTNIHILLGKSPITDYKWSESSIIDYKWSVFHIVYWRVMGHTSSWRSFYSINFPAMFWTCGSLAAENNLDPRSSCRHWRYPFFTNSRDTLW